MNDNDFLPIRILHDFVQRMEKLGIEYMLTGSMAMMPYGMYRLTADIDIVLEIRESDRIRFQNALEPDYYVPAQAMSNAIKSKRVFNVIDVKFAFKVDCAVRKPGDFHLNAFRRRIRTDYFGYPIWIISREDLILSKLDRAVASRSEKQMNDVVNLMSFGYDSEYAETWVNKLGVAELYNECKERVPK